MSKPVPVKAWIRPFGQISGLALVLAGLWASAAMAQSHPLAKTEQAIVVVTENWQGVAGQLQRFERTPEQMTWQPVGQPFSVVVGRKGMGWGKGLFALTDQQVASVGYRQEGDKRAPAGVFSLGSVFGLATPEQADEWLSLSMPYIHLSPYVRCIGDSHSSRYNEIHDIRTIPKDWLNDGANENMRRDAIRDEGAYRWGVFVNHNTPGNAQPRDKVSGSCIFLHIWKGDGSGTSGCTAMTKSDLLDIINWLDESRHPVLIQLPIAPYRRLQNSWDLPDINLEP